MFRFRISILVLAAVAAVAAMLLSHSSNLQAKEPVSPAHVFAVAPRPMQQAAPAVHAAAAGDELPAGDGRDVTTRVCSACHGVNVFAKRRYSEDRWNSVIQSMIGKGMDASDDDLAVVTKYLTTYLARPATPAPPADAPAPPPAPPSR